MPKRKKQSILHILTNNRISALAVVMLTVSMGSYALPRIFAAQQPNVSGLVLYVEGQNVIKADWNGYSVDNRWKYKVYKDGAEVRNFTEVGDTQHRFDSLNCGTNYTIDVIALNANGGNVDTARAGATTSACPAPAPTPAPTPAPAPTPTPAATSSSSSTPTTTSSSPTTTSSGSSSSSSGSSSTSTSKPATTTTTKKSTTSTKKVATAAPAPASTPASTAPGDPANFVADVTSAKIVGLSWGGAPNADHYVINRSNDNSTFSEIGTTANTTYDDETTEFATTYYYQLVAVSADGQRSAVLTAQATTDAFSSSSNVITSRDKLVSATIAEGAVDGSYNCAFSTEELDPSKAPSGQSTLLGPYNLLCVTEDGQVIDSYQKPITIAMKLSSVGSGYGDYNVQFKDGSTWKATKSTYDSKKQTISFTMTSSKSFAAFGAKQKSIIGKIFMILFILLLLAGAVFGLVWWRRRRSGGTGGSSTPVVIPPNGQLPAPVVVPGANAEQEFKEALAQPDCSHLAMAQQVVPSGAGCYECEQQHTKWNALRICLICGHVGCSDDSPEQHSLKHYQQTGHPIIYDYADPSGSNIGWCYIDETYI